MAIQIRGRQAVLACQVADVPANGTFLVSLPDRPPIAVFNLGGEFFALDDTCSHGQASLCEGFVENGLVECPYHSAMFDIRTGEARTMPATEPVRAYPVEVDGEDVYVITE